MSEFSTGAPLNDQSPDGWRYFARRLRRHPTLRGWGRTAQRATSLVPSLWRRATHEYRQLPSVVIAGAQKAGTTQLFAYLIRHPRLLPGSAKEIDYFSRHAQRPVAWYRAQFPLRSSVAKVNGLLIEASPSYMCTPAAIPHMHAVLPNARIIVVLRDPVSRAFSGYQHAKTRGGDARPFHKAVDDELRQQLWRPEPGQALRPGVSNLRSYVARGYYALQLELVLKYYPRDRVLLLDSADLFADTSTTCQRVFDFVGVEPFEVRPEKVYNRGYYSEKIDPHVTQRLREHYRPYDEMLVKLVGQRFSWMPATTQSAAA
jgi:hypothetical protein